MRRRDCAIPLAGLLASVRAGFCASPETVTFSGYLWDIKRSRGRIGPGPNPFSENNVSLERDGSLRLRIAQQGGQWACAEVVSRKSFGYGTYRYYVRDAAKLDPNAVLGLFTWDTAAKVHAYREIDVEVGRWGDPSNENCQFVVQPPGGNDHVLRFEVPSGPMIHEFTWTPDEVRFRAVAGSDASAGKVIRSHTVTDGIPPAGGENARVNLWLLGGRSPQNGRGVEVVLEAFKFVPLP